MIHSIRALDEKVLLLIQPWRRSFFTKILLFLTYSGTGWAWITYAVALFLLDFSGTSFTTDQKVFLQCLKAPLLAFGIGSVIKRSVSRKRPSDKIRGFKQIIHPPSCGSFPSSHTSASISFFISLMLVHHSWVPYIGIWAVLVSFSRMYLGVHFFSDVMAGIVLGIGSAIVVVATFGI